MRSGARGCAKTRTHSDHTKPRPSTRWRRKAASISCALPSSTRRRSDTNRSRPRPLRPRRNVRATARTRRQPSSCRHPSCTCATPTIIRGVPGCHRQWALGSSSSWSRRTRRTSRSGACTSSSRRTRGARRACASCRTTGICC